MKLNEIGLPQGRKKKRVKRLGRGHGDGTGKTAGRGNKGQKARSGGYHKVSFEGGQMPLQRIIPKRGFTNIFRTEYAVINVERLANIPAGTEVDEKYLRDNKFIKKAASMPVKVLGRGEIATALTIKVSAVTESAAKKIEAAGGKVEVVGG